jgi:protoheme ferro-lyase
MLHQLAAGRAQVIMADQLGNQAAYREAYLQILRNQLKTLKPGASVLVILSRHGHPFKKETQDARKDLYCAPLEDGVRKIMANWQGQWDVVWTSDEYGDEYWDKKHVKIETHAAYRRAIDEQYDYALELPTEFPAENTDLMIFHAMKKFNAFPEYDKDQPVPYPDWEKPLVRTFRAGKTIGIYAGTPVGPYRVHVVQAVVNSIAAVLE